MTEVLLKVGLLSLVVAICQAEEIKIAFGSCNKQSDDQIMWKVLSRWRPDVWIWLGDNIYGDVEIIRPWTLMSTEFVPRKPQDLSIEYRKQMRNPLYRDFVASLTYPPIGTWDDHDFGLNNAGKSFVYKNESKELFFDFLGEAADSPIRQQEGVYSAKTYHVGGRSVKVFLLDVRFHKDEWENKDGDMLGEAQWRWLEKEVKNSNADVNIFGSGIQILSNDKVVGENWGLFPSSRERLLQLLLEYNVKNPILLSGDVHFAEVSKVSCGGQIITEVTSSGLTHSWGSGEEGTLLSFMFSIYQLVYPHRFRERKYADVYTGLNAGEITITFEEESNSTKIDIAVIDEKGQERIQMSLPTDQPSPKGSVECVPIRGVQTRIESVVSFIMFSILLLLFLAVPWLIMSSLYQFLFEYSKTKQA